MTVRLRVNGTDHSVDVDPDTPLLYVLRNQLGLKGARFGCGEGTCGACMVLVDGEAAPSCDMPVSTLAGTDIRTLEALVAEGVGQRLVEAFVKEQAAQCGYCMSGILVSACGLLGSNPEPDRDQICEALEPNLCRCGSHWRVVRAVARAASES